MFQNECGYQNGGSLDLEKLLTECLLIVARSEDGQIIPYLEYEENEEIKGQILIYIRSG